MENYGVKCMSMGFLVAEDTPMIWRGPWCRVRYSRCCATSPGASWTCLMVDMPPGTGDAQLTMAQQVPLDRRGDYLDAPGHCPDRRQEKASTCSAGSTCRCSASSRT